MAGINFLHKLTKDGLNLQGVHWNVKRKDICVIFIHGMSGNIIENYFAEKIGDKLAENNIGFLFGHNRGYNHINDIRTNTQDNYGFRFKRIGVTYEIFEDCLYDIDLWVNTAMDLGYKRIVLMGHSLGANKSIYYLYKTKLNKKIVGLILASPPDMLGLIKLKKYQKNYISLLQEAKKNMYVKKPRAILSHQIWDWYNLSSQTFCNFFQENNPIDNLPIHRNPKDFHQLASVQVPILAFLGEFDDIIINTAKNDLNLIKKKAVNCTNFKYFILKGATHIYESKENKLANNIFDWINKEYIK